MKRRITLLILGCCLLLPLANKLVAQPRQPNVLLILTDDQGWGDLRVHGNDKIDTPVLDRLAAESVSFERFFVSPLCAPTRASLLTGRYSQRTGALWVTRGMETMCSEEVTIAEALGQVGYATGVFGKWHNGAHYPHDPRGQRVAGVIKRAHDPSPLPSPDREPRNEVFEKTWARLTLGALKLDTGRARLSVKALSLAGKTVAELKAVQVRRIN